MGQNCRLPSSSEANCQWSTSDGQRALVELKWTRYMRTTCRPFAAEQLQGLTALWATTPRPTSTWLDVQSFHVWRVCVCVCVCGVRWVWMFPSGGGMGLFRWLWWQDNPPLKARPENTFCKKLCAAEWWWVRWRPHCAQPLDVHTLTERYRVMAQIFFCSRVHSTPWKVSSAFNNLYNSPPQQVNRTKFQEFECNLAQRTHHLPTTHHKDSLCWMMLFWWEVLCSFRRFPPLILPAMTTCGTFCPTSARFSIFCYASSSLCYQLMMCIWFYLGEKVALQPVVWCFLSFRLNEMSGHQGSAGQLFVWQWSWFRSKGYRFHNSIGSDVLQRRILSHE